MESVGEPTAPDRSGPLVQALAYAAECLLSDPDCEHRLGEVLTEIGRAVTATRAAIYDLAPGESNGRQARLVAEWRRNGAAANAGTRAFPRWILALSQGGAIFGPVATLPTGEQEALSREGVKSVMAVSVAMMPSGHHGALVFEDAAREHEWTQADLQFAMAIAHALGAAFAQERARHDLLNAEARYRAIVETQTELICRFQPDGRVTFANEAYARHLGLTPARALEVSLWNALPPDAVTMIKKAAGSVAPGGLPATVLHRIPYVDGSEMWVQWEIVAISTATGGLLEYQAVGTDVTERQRLMVQLEHEAYFDELTGIANRRMFEARGRRDLAAARARPRSAALLLVDLDRFKHLNDSLGHAAGDEALVEIARRLEHVVRSGDTLARMGGDEYAVLLPGANEAEAAAVGERILDAVSRPLNVQERTVRLAASVGAAMFPRGGHTLEDLLRHADTAMYRAKSEGGGLRFYDESLDGPAQERLGLESDFREALDLGQIEVTFQPVRTFRSGEIVGVEALARWDHAVRGDVPPGAFLSAVEDTPTAETLDRWVIGEALRHLSGWRRAGWRGWVSVNLTQRTILSKGLVPMVAESLESAGIEAESLLVELTEHILADPSRVLHAFHGLRNLGVRLAIDDFGAGHASFAYLENFPVDILKVDQQFVRRPWRQLRAGALVPTMVSLGHSLGMQVLAEGIETEEQFSSVRDAGCDLGQGFLLGRPLPAVALEELLLGRRNGNGAARGTA